MSAPFGRALRAVLAAVCWPLYLMLYAPLLLVAYYSVVPPGKTAVSFAAYAALLGDANVSAALERSLLLALVSATLSTALGTLLGYGLSRFRAPDRNGAFAALTSLVIYLPIVMPSLVFGIAELIAFNAIHRQTGLLAPGLGTMLIAHVTFQIPYVALTVFARLAGVDAALFDAAHDLYADGLKSFVFVIVPLVRPAIVGGFLLAVTLSIDDFTISFFTAGPGSVTLPIYLYSAISRHGVSPEINALGTVVIVSVVLLALAYNLVNGREWNALSS